MCWGIPVFWYPFLFLKILRRNYKNQMNKEDRLFTNKMIINFIIPMAIEKVLLRSISIVDNIMVSHLGEDILSGVELASRFNIFIYDIFIGLVLGGMILVSQLLGRKDINSARRVTYTLTTFLTLISLLFSVIIFFGSENIVSLLYGQINEQTHNSAVTYLKVLATACPMQVVYFCGTYLSRAMKDSKTPTIISVARNIINILCNYVFIYKFNMGVLGAAFGTIAAYYTSAIIISILLCNRNREIYYELDIKKYRINFNSLKEILSLSISTAMDRGFFQLGKLAVASILSSFGSVQVAAYVVVSGIDSIIEILPDSVSMASTTIIGQCTNVKDTKQIKYYARKLMIMGILSTIVVLPIMLLLLPLLHASYDVSNEVWHLAMILATIAYISTVLFYIPSFTLAYILRATGDAKYVMMISTFSMWVFRFGISLIVAKCFGLGVIGIRLAMTTDYIFRSIMFTARYRSGKWQQSKSFSKA